MPFVNIDNVRIFYRLEGSDDRPVLVMSHSLGCDHGQWDVQTRDLLPYFRILRHDMRGHGASDIPPNDYSIDRLGRDVMAIVDALGIEKFAFCGLSIGGLIGQWLGASAPNRITHLVLANTSPRMDTSAMETRRRTVLENGMAAVADAVMGRFFSPETLARHDPDVASVRRTLLNTDPRGYAGCCAAIRDADQTGLLAQIRIPALIISGDCDVSTPWAGHGEVLAREIPNARVVHLPTAHLSNLERPRSFSSALCDFLVSANGDVLEAGYHSATGNAGRCLRRCGHRENYGLHARVSGSDHALRVGNCVDASWIGPAHAPVAGTLGNRAHWDAGKSSGCTCARACSVRSSPAI